MEGWLYVVACVVTPALWGVFTHLVFGALDRRRRRGASPADIPPVDYSI